MSKLKIFCVLGEHNYGNPARGECYEYANFLPALRNLGHEIIFFESFNRSCYRDFADLNRKFLETVQSERPDVIFCVLLGYEIWRETFDLVRQGTSAILVNWSTDDSWKYEQFSRYVAPNFDIYVTTYPEAVAKALKDGHSNFYLSQWAANSENLKPPLPADECRYSVSFVGSSYGNRKKWVEAIGLRGIDVTCFGHGWPNGPVEAKQIPEIMRQSKISLNFGDSGIVMRGLIPVRSRQIKARVFEVPGAGGFILTQRADNMANFFKEGKELVVYDGLGDLVEKLHYFLENPEERDRIANAGYLRTRDHHTYELRFENILKMASQIAESRVEDPYKIDFQEFDSLASNSQLTFFLRVLRAVVKIPCVFIWGKDRGPRAARRIVFEISWRVAKAHTYSVFGWPGRMFYREN